MQRTYSVITLLVFAAAALMGARTSCEPLEPENAPCRYNRDCPSEEISQPRFCEKEPGECDLLGECRPRPLRCSRVFSPVCGCNDRTYDNECLAHKEGINVDYFGPCGDLIACKSDSDCPDPEEDDWKIEPEPALRAPLAFCQKADGDCDGEGFCVFTPPSCPDIDLPVCGCDGTTYQNRCLATLERVNVATIESCD